MEFRILGPLEVVEGGRRLRFGGPRERALLALLLIHAGEVVSADRLIDGLWGGELPANPANALQVAVSRVRRALKESPAPGRPAERLVTRTPGYLLDVDPEELDASSFDRLVREARQAAPADHERRSSLLTQALGLWRGPALADFALEDFAREEVARLEEARIRAVELRVDADLALGRHAELVAELKGLVAGHRQRERLRGQLMLALYRSGRQGEALRAFQEGRAALARELGVDPGPELRELHQRILLQAPSLALAPNPDRNPDPAAAPSAGAAAPANNLPAAVTSFVGRHAQLREADRLLAGSRLVTLTGPGGCGKTRLALEAAKARLEHFPDGVWLVELDALGDPALVPQALAAGVGIRDGGLLGVGGQSPKPPLDKLAEYLREKELLVVLDNCEHLVEACAGAVERVLRAAPGVRVLATSRERLGVDGEALLPVPPLGLPPLGETSPRLLAESEAVRLFADRAGAVQPAFVLDDETGPAVDRICRGLDGIPLALELAAAQVRILSPAQIAARLDDRLGGPAAGGRRALPRHRTLRAAVEWSYGLLSEPERELFARLSVFAGGFTLEAAEAVCGDGDGAPTDVLELLSRLVDQSLVVPGAGPDARFRMLETLRRFAAERLAESGTAEELRRRHAYYLLELAEHAEPLLRGPEQALWLRRLQAEYDDFSAAADWALRADAELAARLSSALAYFWLIGRHRSEARRRLAEAVEAARGASAGNRARMLAWAAQLANVEGRPDAAAAQAREAYELSRQVGDAWSLALSGTVLGLALGLRGEIDRAGEYLEAACTEFDALGEVWGVAIATMLLGYASTFAAGLAGVAGHERAAALTRRSLEGFRSAGDLWGQTMALELLGLLARRRGAHEDAVAAYEEALGVVRDLGLRDEVPFLLVELGDLQVLRGDLEAAAILHKQALDLARDLGARDAAAFARTALALAARRQGHYARAAELHQEALSFYREAGFTADAARSLAYLGYVEELRGELNTAASRHRESLRLARDLQDESAPAAALEGLACVAAARREPERAAVILGAAESIRSRTGTLLAPQERAEVDRATAAATDALGREAFAAAVERGSRMGIQDAIAYEPSGDAAA